MPLPPLIAATYFMVSGGPYGLEDIVGQAGYARALLLLSVVPLVWSLPTALMVGELASAMPEEGGFYVWVTRALGRFWGFQEAWLSLVSSIFDMAIYPALAVAYVGQLNLALLKGSRGVLFSLCIVALCVAWNLRGAAAVGRGSLWMFALLLTPFIGILFFGMWSAAAPFHTLSSGMRPMHGSLTTALLFAMWNYMGWDNASTIAREVEDPQRNYIRAMLAAVLLVTSSYVLPVAVVALAAVPASAFVTGAWADVARTLAAAHLGARAAAWLGICVVAGGALTGVAMFNSLTLSYARVPASMAQDGLLPKIFARHLKNGVPWVAVLACGVAWALALGLALTRLLELDIMLYGLSLVLEFVALVMLRQREPEMPRPFRIPGGRFVLSMIAIVPSALVFFAIWAARSDRLTPRIPAIALGAALIFAGPLLYGAFAMGRRLR
ncbi:MAG TPA: APC family permease [Acidobacteriaceae bacterium]|nr:APC family permease [Acidobacteriaceae bacterium]